MPADLTPAGRARFEDRERIAAAAAVAHVLRPASVALVGVSKRPGSVGAAVLGNLRAGGFTGRLCVVHPRGEAFDGVETYRSFADVPWPVELAVIAVPSAAVNDVARSCGAAGVRALVVVSAGFAELGDCRLRPPGGAAGHLPCLRHAARRPELPRRAEHRGRAQRVVRPGAAAARRCRVRLPERGVRDRRGRRGGAAQPRALLVRVDRQQGRPVGQRPAPVLGGRPRHRRDRPLPRVLRQPAPVRPHRAARERQQAGDRRQERALGGRGARRGVAHRRARRRLRRHRRCAVPPLGRDPHRHRRRAVRRRRTARRAAAPARRSRRRSSPTPAARASRAPTPAPRPACASSRSAPVRSRACARRCRPRPRSPTPWT